MAIGSMKRSFLRASRLLGFEETLIDLQLNHRYNIDVDRAIRDFQLSPEESNGTVVFPMVRGGQATVLTIWFVSVLGHAFETRGYRPLYVSCGGGLDLCHGTKAIDDRFGDSLACSICRTMGRSIYERFGHDYVDFGGILGEEYEYPTLPEEPADFEYRNVSVADYAIASTRKQLQKYHVDLDADRDREVFTRYLRSGMKIVDAAEKLHANESIAAVIGHHPCYIQDGLFLEVATAKDVPARTVQLNTLSFDETRPIVSFGNFTNRSPLAHYTDQDYLETVVSRPLTGRERDRVDEILYTHLPNDMKRRFGVEDEKTLEVLEGDSETIGLFTNLMWDASLEAEGRQAFDPFSWVKAAIEELGGDDGVALVVKPHPAEESFGTNEPMEEWLRNEFERLPRNVLIADRDLDSYELLPRLNAGVVYNSTIGLEMASRAIPVIVTGETHYKGLGFTLEPDTREAFGRMLRERASPSDEMTRRAKRYLYFLFEKKYNDVPFLVHDGDEQTMRTVQHDRLTPGNEDFDRIVDGLLAGEPVVAGRRVSAIEQ